MKKFLKLILILQLLGWLGIVISNFSNDFLSLFIVFIINLLIWFGLWKSVDFVVNNPENRTQNEKANVVRWLLSFFFSIFTVEVGLIIAFIIRFFIDRGYAQGSVLATIIVDNLGRHSGSVITGTGVLFAFPIMYLIEKAVEFSKPLVPALIFILLWFLLIFLVGPLLPSGG
jgi:hypothetical protein